MSGKSDNLEEVVKLLDIQYKSFVDVKDYADKYGHPHPCDTRSWSQIIISSLTGIKGIERKKGSDLDDGSDVKGANTWGAIDTPRFNGCLKAGTKSIVLYGIYKTVKKENWTFEGVCGAACLGGFAGILPDILEPAVNNPNHRAFFHSLSFLSLFLFRNKVYDKLNLSDNARCNCNIALAGYLSHLALDFTTKKSLPPI